MVIVLQALIPEGHLQKPKQRKFALRQPFRCDSLQRLGRRRTVRPRRVLLGHRPDGKDSDTDGIPDGWEIACDRDPTCAADATNRAANGYTYLQPYQAELTPTNPTSQMRFTHIGTAGNDIAITWIGGCNAPC